MIWFGFLFNLKKEPTMKTMCGRVSFNMLLKAALVLHVHLHVPWVLLTASQWKGFSQWPTVVSSSLGLAKGPQAKHLPLKISSRVCGSVLSGLKGSEPSHDPGSAFILSLPAPLGANLAPVTVWGYKVGPRDSLGGCPISGLRRLGLWLVAEWVKRATGSGSPSCGLLRDPYGSLSVSPAKTSMALSQRNRGPFPNIKTVLVGGNQSSLTPRCTDG